MTTDINHILIFKTNIQTKRDKLRIQRELDTLETIQQWNIDLEDIDCVLRIVSDRLTPEQIILVVKDNGFECSELE